MALLMVATMAVVGMVGSYSPQDLIQGDPLAALAAFDADVTLEGWGTNQAATEQGFYGAMVTPATENYWAMMSDEGSMLGAEAEQALDRAEEESYYPTGEFRKHRISSGPNSGVKHVIG